MITSFEVGAVFKIINQASPALAQILKQVRELNLAIDNARKNLATSVAPLGLSKAVGETEGLATAWGNVARNAAAAQRAIGSASSAAARGGGGGAAGAAARGGGGGGRHRPGFLGGGGSHIGGPGVSIRGGGHMRLGGAGMAGAGLMGYGIYEAAQMEDAVFQLIYHSGLEQNDANRGKFRKMLQDSMRESGYGLHDIAESAKQEIRMFAGTPGHGLDVLPEMLRAATIESRLKGESPEASMKALIGLAHMTKQYDPAAIRKLAPAFAFLSTANPSSLGSIEKAAGYAVPLLQSGLEVDPIQSLLLGTALTRAGATSTKSGTWLREMALRAMPGTSMMSKMAFRKHEEALKEVGLVDDQHKPTWFTDGKPDLLKMLDIAGGNAAKIPIERRAAIERGLFGAQGGGGFALLADPAVREQILSLQKEMNSPEFKNRYATFSETYKEGSTVQQARTAMAEFNITMMEIGKTVLPSVNIALKDFKGALEGLRSVLPGGQTALTGARAMQGGILGGIAGIPFGPPGVAAGAAAGTVLGTAEGFMEGYSKAQGAKQDRKETDDFIKALRENHAGAAAGAPAQAVMSTAPISLSLNVDGRALASAVTDALGNQTGFVTQAPSADGVGQFYGGDHNYPDK
jgi:hypothetical protein